MKTITMLEFRSDARRWLDAVQRGETFVLTYRGEPVARLEPFRPAEAQVSQHDSLLRIDDFAVDGAGGTLTKEEIDRAVYEP